MPAPFDEQTPPEELEAALPYFWELDWRLYDLYFLALEAHLTRYVLQDSSLQHLLANAYIYHARALLDMNRHSESSIYGERALRTASVAPKKSPQIGQAAIALASAYASRSQKNYPHHTWKLLAKWEPFAVSSDIRAWMQSEQGIHLARAGCSEQALKMGRSAIQMMQEEKNIIDTEMRIRDYVLIQKILGNYQDALEDLARLELLRGHSPDSSIRHALLEAECLLGLGKKESAASAIENIRTLLETHQSVYLRPSLTRLESLFQQVST